MNSFLIAELIGEIKTLNSTLTNINKEVFDAKGAAEYLCMGYDTILRLTRIGQIEYVRNGTSYLYKKEFLDNWLDENRRRSKVYR